MAKLLKDSKLALAIVLVVVLALSAPSIAFAANTGNDSTEGSVPKNVTVVPDALKDMAAQVDAKTYHAVSITNAGRDYNTKGQYVVLNGDGSGMLVLKREAYTIEWKLNGDALTGTDNTGKQIQGTLDKKGNLKLQYRDFEMACVLGDNAPIMSLSPETWFAGLPSVVDQAGLLTSQETSMLEAKAKEVSAKYECGVYLVVLGDMKDYCALNNINACSEEIRVGYQLGFGEGHDCVMLVMSMSERDYDLLSFGPYGLEKAFDAEARDWVVDKFLPKLKKNDWYGGFTAYLNGAETVLQKRLTGESLYSPSGFANIGLAALFCLLIGFVIALIVSGIIRGRMKSVRPGSEASQYFEPDGVQITYRNDYYTHSTTSRTYSPRQKSSGGGGGFTSSSGHGHSSGKF